MSFLFQLPTTLPETNIASENRWLEDDSILPGFHFFNCELLDSGRESTILNRRNIPTKLGKEFSTQQHPPPPPRKKYKKHLSTFPLVPLASKKNTSSSSIFGSPKHFSTSGVTFFRPPWDTGPKLGAGLTHG